MKLTDAIINKWFCLHEWKPAAEIKTSGTVTGVIYFCNKCGKSKRLEV